MLTLHKELKSKFEYPQPGKGALPAILQLVIEVRFYACGSFLGIIGDMHGVNKATAWKTLHRVTENYRTINRVVVTVRAAYFVSTVQAPRQKYANQVFIFSSTTKERPK